VAWSSASTCPRPRSPASSRPSDSAVPSAAAARARSGRGCAPSARCGSGRGRTIQLIVNLGSRCCAAARRLRSGCVRTVSWRRCCWSTGGGRGGGGSRRCSTAWSALSRWGSPPSRWRSSSPSWTPSTRRRRRACWARPSGIWRRRRSGSRAPSRWTGARCCVRRTLSSWPGAPPAGRSTRARRGWWPAWRTPTRPCVRRPPPCWRGWASHRAGGRAFPHFLWPC
jgi:hypothetical protein